MLCIVIVGGVTLQVVATLVPVRFGQVLVEEICQVSRCSDDVRAQLLIVSLGDTK